MTWIQSLLTISILLFSISCKEQSRDTASDISYSRVEGKTMGTYYRVTYSDTLNIQSRVEDILGRLNQEMSTYIEDSKISQFNAGSDSLFLSPGIFLDNYLISKELYLKSNGLYDPSVMPLVNYWGFGYSEKKEIDHIDSLAIEDIMQYVGMNKLVEIEKGEDLILVKKDPRVELDFSSVAKGYAVDMIADYLDSLKIVNYLVDIGGEMLLQGKNPKGKHWSIGINTPTEDASLSEAFRYLKITDKALATSGNYRNFYEKNGIKVSHTINALNGFPERTKLLSVSIVAPSCALADAWATTCMVVGMDAAEALLKEEEHIDACFIYVENEEFKSKYINHFKSYIAE